MGNYVKIQTFIIPNSFENTFNEFLTLVQKDDEFKRILETKKTKTGVRDKRYVKQSQNKMISLSIRFGIVCYVKQKKMEALAEAKRTKLPQQQNNVPAQSNNN